MNGAIGKIKSGSSNKRMLLFLLLGPLALILTLAVAFTKPIADPLFLTMAVVGFVMSYQWGIKGFIVGAVGVAVFAFQLHSDHLWQILYSSSLLLGFLITALSTEEARTLLLRMQSHSELTYEKLQKLKEEAGKKEDAYQDAIKNLHEKIAQLEKSVVAYEAIAKLAKHEAQSLELASQKRSVNTKPTEEFPIELSFDYDQNTRDQYKQLRKQFDEKTEVLRQTRQQLFLMENQLLATEKKVVETQEEEYEEFLLWQKLFADMQRQQEYLKNQLSDMEKLVGQLVSGLDVSRL